VSHDRNQSILYKVTSPQMLADRLLISRGELDALLADADPYKRWIEAFKAVFKKMEQKL